MDVNSTFILSDYNLQNVWYPWSDSNQITENLKYHILSPEEKYDYTPTIHRTACKVHSAITRNLFLYSCNPSSGNIGKKIAARFLALHSCVLEFFSNYFIIGFMPVIIGLIQLVKRAATMINTSESREKAYLKVMIEQSKNSWLQASASITHGVVLPVEFLLGGSAFLNMSMPGFKILNKKTQRNEFLLDLNKLDYLRKYCGWEDTSEKEVLDLLEDQLKDSQPFLEYDIDDKNNLHWKFLFLEKSTNSNTVLKIYINGMIEHQIVGPNA